MTWIIKETTYAGHKITIEYHDWDHELVASIRGPRAGSGKSKRTANSVTWKINSRIPFMSPTINKVAKNVRPIWREAEKRIDKAIAEHAKKYEDEYQ